MAGAKRQWLPTWGVGLGALGPAMAAVQGQYLPARWFAIEGGTLPTRDVLLGYAGVRVRSGGKSEVHPFLGGFVNVGIAYDQSTYKSDRMVGAGPRTGLDIESEPWIVTVEFDLVYPISEYWFNLRGPVVPWGGLAVGYFF